MLSLAELAAASVKWIGFKVILTSDRRSRLVIPSVNPIASMRCCELRVREDRVFVCLVLQLNGTYRRAAFVEGEVYLHLLRHPLTMFVHVLCKKSIVPSCTFSGLPRLSCTEPKSSKTTSLMHVTGQSEELTASCASGGRYHHSADG